ncbi:MAG: RidA family protein [Polyangiaceae bacterium]|nr:RidA family protein [Polyangiaceae bacterium]
MDDRRAITTPTAPAAIGPYSQAIAVGGLVWTSGQIPLDPATGELVGVDAASQTERVLDNLAAILKACGCSLGDVVKTTIYLVDLKEFADVNAVYARRFDALPPARATVQVAALPRGARVEIEAIARIPAGASD